MTEKSTLVRGSGPSTQVAPTTIVAIALAAALVPLNSTMLAVALPKVARAFDIGRGRAGLLITVYLVAMLVGQPLSGRVSDAFGSKRVVLVSLLGFAACSLWAVAVPTFQWHVIARGVQAVFASALAPSVQSMLRSVASPRQRGRAFGILGSVIGVGAAAGPIVGGVLVGAFGWKAIFLVNLPVVALTALVLVRVHVPADERLDTPDAPAKTPSRCGASSDLLQPSYLAALATQALANLGQYSLLLVAPLVLDHRGWSSGTTGLALSALTVGLIVMSPLGGRFGDRVGRATAVTRGLMVGAAGAVLVVPFGLSVSPIVLVVALGVFGSGLGFSTPSITAAGVAAVPSNRTGVAAGLLSASRYVGSIIASLLLAAFVADDGSGARVMYLAAAGALLLAVVASRRMSSEL